MMDLQTKEEWLKALRSGRYSQTQGTLRHQRGTTKNDKPLYGYCCLGVLCNVVDRRKWDGEGVHPLSIDDGSSVDSAKTGLTKLQISKLIDLNDEEEASFDEIADWIEKKVNAK